MNKNRIDIIEQGLQGNGQPPDDRLETLISMADDLKGMIEFLSNPHSRFNKTFIAHPVESLWQRYFMIRLKILEFHPETKHMNQGERAQEVQQEMENFSPIEKSLKTISRWDALKTDDMM